MSFKRYLSYARALTGIINGNRAFGGPIRACLSLTNRCNIRCNHCLLYSPFIEKPNYFQVRRSKLLDVELPEDKDLKRIQKIDADKKQTHAIINALIKMGTGSFEFTGGEPFLHENALEFMGRARDAGCTGMLNSNGTLLDPEMIDELIKIGFDELRITTMAGTREMYILTHPGAKAGSFDSLKNNLLYLADRKAALGVMKPKLNLAFIIISQNSEDIFDFTEFAALVKADRVLFRPVNDFDDPGLQKVVPSSEQAALARGQLIEAKTYLDSQGIAHNIDLLLRVFGQQLDTRRLYRVIACYYGWLWVLIDSDGAVYPCCRCYESLRNTHTKNFSEIWDGKAYRQFRNEAKKINRRKSPVEGYNCNRCSHFDGNLRVFRILHPIKGRSSKLEIMCPEVLEQDN
ncbi:MAG: radical SAM protein [Desulfobacterales bacterium]|nr:MAG: radical SAM protein [Desulfobacterales bacterium]